MLTKRFAAMLVCTLAALPAIGCSADPETAVTRTASGSIEGRVSGTGGIGLRVRTEPRTTGAQIDSVWDGQIVTIGCQVEGEAILGNNVWNYLEEEGGYVADAFVVTGVDGFVPGAKRCDGSTEAKKGGADRPATGSTPAGVSKPVNVSGGFSVRGHVQSFANDACGRGACAISTYGGHHPTADRALDILISEDYGAMASDGYALGDEIANFALANMAKYDIWYVILKQQINYGSGWQRMEDRGSVTQNHYDHVHVSFWD